MNRKQNTTPSRNRARFSTPLTHRPLAAAAEAVKVSKEKEAAELAAFERELSELAAEAVKAEVRTQAEARKREKEARALARAQAGADRAAKARASLGTAGLVQPREVKAPPVKAAPVKTPVKAPEASFASLLGEVTTTFRGRTFTIRPLKADPRR